MTERCLRAKPFKGDSNVANVNGRGVSLGWYIPAYTYIYIGINIYLCICMYIMGEVLVGLCMLQVLMIENQYI